MINSGISPDGAACPAIRVPGLYASIHWSMDEEVLKMAKMTVPARVVGDLNMGAVVAALDVTAKRRSAAGLDRRHDLQLAEADVAGVGSAPRRAMSAKDVGDLQARPRHRQAGGGRLARFTPSRSKGLVTSRIVLTATRV